MKSHPPNPAIRSKPSAVITFITDSPPLASCCCILSVGHLKNPNLVETNSIDLLSVRDIAITKSYTIGRRVEIKDYVDLYYILRDKHVDLADIILGANEIYGTEFNSRLFLEQLIVPTDIKPVPIDFIGEVVSITQMQDYFEDCIREYEI